MIIGNLFGGLGNQMFQYAFVRCLSIEKNENFAFTIDMIYFYRKNNIYELKKAFNLDLNILNEKQINFKSFYFLKYPLIRFIFSKIKVNIFSFYFEKHISIKQKFYFNKNSDTKIFYGYWQNEDYFTKYRSIILNDFRFHISSDELNTQIYNLIKSKNSVSIHIRRGDYKNSKSHNCLNLEYYLKAIEHLKSMYKNIYFFVFSDDIQWVKNNLDENNFIVIDNNQKNPYIDMYLMSQCNHNIIANSSFSWWAAWLNTNEQKKIIAPRKWYNNKKIQPIPTNWVLI